MEVFLVYALVGVFFLLTVIFVLTVLAKQPYRDPSPLPSASAMESPQSGFSAQDRRIAYSILTLFLLLLCVLALVEGRKERTTHSGGDNLTRQ